jgi:hypothetical protein
MGVARPCPVTKAIFSAIAEAKLGLFIAEIIERSSGRCPVAEATATEAGRIRLKTRTIASRAGRSIVLFFMAPPIIYYPKTETPFLHIKISPGALWES